MRSIKRMLVLAVAFSILSFLAPAPATHASGFYRYVDVYYQCICGGCQEGLVGHWEIDCDGNMTGYGEPPQNDGWCFYTVEWFEPCP